MSVQAQRNNGNILLSRKGLSIDSAHEASAAAAGGTRWRCNAAAMAMPRGIADLPLPAT